MTNCLSLDFKLLITLLILGFGNCHPKSETRIIDGRPAAPGQFPYQVSLHDRDMYDYGDVSFFCSGSIYNENYVITSASCVVNKDPGSIYIIAGQLKLGEIEDGVQSSPVDKLILHEMYYDSYYWNDIALIKLSKPLTFTAFVNSINLSREGYSAEGEAFISGWGDTEDGPTDVLKFTDVDIISDDICRSVYEEDFIESMICTLKGTHTGCYGDYGGPLTCNPSDPKNLYLCGVFAYGGFCGDPDYPEAYSEISYFVSWIEDMTKFD